MRRLKTEIGNGDRFFIGGKEYEIVDLLKENVTIRQVKTGRLLTYGTEMLKRILLATNYGLKDVGGR